MKKQVGKHSVDKKTTQDTKESSTPIAISPGLVATALARAGILFTIKEQKLLMHYQDDVANAAEGLLWLAQNLSEFAQFMSNNAGILERNEFFLSGAENILPIAELN